LEVRHQFGARGFTQKGVFCGESTPQTPDPTLKAFALVLGVCYHFRIEIVHVDDFAKSHQRAHVRGAQIEDL